MTDNLPPPLGFAEPGSFPYLTLNRRMPVILTRAIDDVYVRAALLAVPISFAVGCAVCCPVTRATIARPFCRAGVFPPLLALVPSLTCST